MGKLAQVGLASFVFLVIFFVFRNEQVANIKKENSNIDKELLEFKISAKQNQLHSAKVFEDKDQIADLKMDLEKQTKKLKEIEDEEKKRKTELAEAEANTKKLSEDMMKEYQKIEDEQK